MRAEPAMHLVRTRGESTSRAVVGDWVALSRPAGHDIAIIEAILPRSSAFVRKDPGEATGEQVVAANVDTVFVDAVARRARREPAAARARARPGVGERGDARWCVLTKADLAEDAEDQRAMRPRSSAGVDVVVTSAVTGTGHRGARAVPGSGHDRGACSAVRESASRRSSTGSWARTCRPRARSARVDSKGRHTTVAREMVHAAGGGVVIDTPGMRAMALWDAEEGIEAAFPEIDALAEACKFADCRHETEPGCAVLEAVETGELAGASPGELPRPEARARDARGATEDERAWRQKEHREGKAS